MTSSLPELPPDLAGCHLLIRQLREESQRAAEQAAVWEGKARDAEARVDHLESLVTEYQQTVARYEETVEGGGIPCYHDRGHLPTGAAAIRRRIRGFARLPVGRIGRRRKVGGPCLRPREPGTPPS